MGKTQEKLVGSIAEDYDLDRSDVRDAKDINPSLQLKDGESFRGFFVTDTPKRVEYMNKKTGEQEIKRVHIVENSIGARFTLWLSAKTIRMGVASIAKAHGNHIKGVEFVISKRLTTLKPWGEVSLYDVREIKGAYVADMDSSGGGQ